MKVVLGVSVEYFLYSCFTGLVLAFVYDIIKLTRHLIKTKDILINFEDILFLFMASIACVAEAYMINNGVIRIYSLFAKIAVFFLYRLIVGEHLVYFLVKLLNILFFPVRFLVTACIKNFNSMKKRIAKSKNNECN